MGKQDEYFFFIVVRILNKIIILDSNKMYSINQDIIKLFTIFEEEKLEIKDNSYKEGLEAIARLR